MDLLGDEGDPLPRWVRYAAIPLTGLFLTGVFIHLGFPYEPLVARAFQRVEQERGIKIRYEEVSGHISIFGPGVQARGVVVSRRAADDIEIDRLILRAAWSVIWLQGQPSVHVDARMPIGRARGAIAVGEPAGFDGSFEDLELAALPIEKYAGGLKLRGSLDADIDVHYEGDGKWSGWARLSAKDGSLGLPGQPVAIPFDSLEAQLSLGPDEASFLTVESAEFRGPMISASAAGQVARAPGGPAQLDLELELSVVDQALKPVLRRLGLRLSDDGKATARLGGTLASPVLR